MQIVIYILNKCTLDKNCMYIMSITFYIFVCFNHLIISCFSSLFVHKIFFSFFQNFFKYLLHFKQTFLIDYTFCFITWYKNIKLAWIIKIKVHYIKAHEKYSVYVSLLKQFLNFVLCFIIALCKAELN